MNVIQILRHYSIFFLGDQKPGFRNDYHRGLAYMKSFPEPVDDFQRSFFQYKCQTFYQPWYGKVICNLASLFLIIPYMLRLCLRNHTSQIIVPSENVAIFTESEDWKNLIPEVLFQEYSHWYYCIKNENQFLKCSDILFVMSIWRRYPFQFFFVFKNMMKIAFYRYIFMVYSPVVFVTETEYSFTSSILTCYCEKNGVRHVNVMHGERALEIRASFFRYHKFYVWDEHYRSIFLRLRAYPEQFTIAVPPALKIDVPKWREEGNICDFKYYLNASTEEELKQIVSIIKNIYRYGFKIKVRPHPVYTDLNLLKAYLNIHYIESTDVPIEYSISNTNAVISGGSTVLYQAYLCGIEAIWDDIMYKKILEKLATVDYIMLTKDLKYLSSVLEARGITKWYC